MSILRSLRTRHDGQKVVVIGLDCAAPELVFDQWRDDLPNLSRLAQRGLWGDLESCIPAITIPAWSCMLSGKEPGELGIYGFRNRADHSYDGMFIATGDHVHEKRVWDYLSGAGKRSAVIGVPQTYPVRPLKGWLISGFLTPNRESHFAYPDRLRREILGAVPDYDFDVPQFRTEEKEWLLQQIIEMTEKHFLAVDYLMAKKRWDFLMLMEIGVDRIHHGFWSYHDPQHPKYEPGNPFERAIHDYYVRIDEKVGDWLEMVPEDTAILVVSDHGAKSMQGGVCINEWLWREGYLSFVHDPNPSELKPFREMEVDWSRTTAWGEGGYYGRIFMNVRGREPQGIVSPWDYERVRDELAEKIEAIPGPDGQALGTRAFRPQQIYRLVRGIAPDLMVYFGDLSWRSVGSLGHGNIHTFENDTGPDTCNHARNGLFILYDPRNPGEGQKIEGAQIYDVAATILDLFDLPAPPGAAGRSLVPHTPIP